MFVSGSALPLPPVYDEIIDCVETWGATFKCGWNTSVYKYIYRNIATEESKHTLYGECLFPLVKAKIDKYFLFDAREAMFFNWVDYFDALFATGADFFTLSTGSLRFIRERAEEASMPMLLYTTANTTPERAVVSNPDIVPPSPESSQSITTSGEWTN